MLWDCLESDYVKMDQRRQGRFQTGGKGRPEAVKALVALHHRGATRLSPGLRSGTPNRAQDLLGSESSAEVTWMRKENGPCTALCRLLWGPLLRHLDVFRVHQRPKKT